MFPFIAVYKGWNATASPHQRWLGMFMYTQIQDAMGDTKESRKGLMGAVGKKSLLVLSAEEAGCYDTGRWFASPLIEEQQREQRRKILTAVYLGETLPLQTCPVCNGLGRTSFEFHEDQVVNGVWRPTESARSCELHNPLVKVTACGTCEGSGYYTNPESIDVQAARDAALKGDLGPELKRAEHERRGSGLVVPVVELGKKRRGGWGSQHDR